VLTGSANAAPPPPPGRRLVPRGGPRLLRVVDRGSADVRVGPGAPHVGRAPHRLQARRPGGARGEGARRARVGRGTRRQVRRLGRSGSDRPRPLPLGSRSGDLRGGGPAGHRRDPGLYVNECSNAIFSLIKKEYAPKAERARSATTRLKAMPALLDQGLKKSHRARGDLASFAVQSVAGIGPSSPRASWRWPRRNRATPGRRR